MLIIQRSARHSVPRCQREREREREREGGRERAPMKVLTIDKRMLQNLRQCRSRCFRTLDSPVKITRGLMVLYSLIAPISF